MLSNKTKNNEVYDSFFLEQTFNTPQMLTHSQTEIQWLASKLNLSKSATIIDVACGSGRHLNAFADMGFSSIGIDTSPSCIEMAKKNCPEIKNNILETDFLIYAKNTSVNYDLVFIAGASFGYDSSLDVNIEHLKNLLRLVAPDGRLVIQYLNRNWANFFVKSTKTFWIENSDYFILDERTLNKKLLESEKIFISQSEYFQKRYSDVIHTFTQNEVIGYVKELESAENLKFTPISHTDSFRDKPFSEESSATPVLIFQRQA